MDTNNDLLRLATRIHFALRRQYGVDVQIDALMHDHVQAREALWVCEASEDAELRALARKLRRIERAAEAASEKAAPTAAAPQDAAWADNTSGFGMTSAVGLDPAQPERATGFGWLNPSNWLKRDGASRHH